MCTGEGCAIPPDRHGKHTAEYAARQFASCGSLLMASCMPAYRALLAGVLILLSGFSFGAAEAIKTPFQLVPLWSDEMLGYLIGRRQAACSGVNSATCERLNTGSCDGTAYFRIVPSNVQGGVPFRRAAKQTESANPQYFELQLRNAGYSGVSRIFDYTRAELDAIELVFACSFSGNARRTVSNGLGPASRIERARRGEEVRSHARGESASGWPNRRAD
jgi:hypothetical protein